MAVAEPQLRTLTPEQVDKFHVDGYLVVEDLLTPDEVADLAERTDLIAAGKSRSTFPRTSIQLERIFREGEREVENQVLSVRKLYNLAVYDDLLWGHVTNPKVVDVIADLHGYRRHQALRRPTLHEAPRNRRRPGLAPGLRRLARHPADGPG